MNYDPDDFILLVSTVESEGGYVQPDACEGRPLMYELDGKTRKVLTTHCNLHARMAVPYDPSEPIDLETYAELPRQGGKTTVRNRIKHDGEPTKQNVNVVPVCAVDDAVGLWPRYQHLMGDGSYQR